MTTLTSGSTDSFSLDPFDYMDVTASQPCVGSIVCTSGAQNLQPSQSFGVQNRRYGPFGVPMAVAVSVASGTMTYAITEGSGGSGAGVTLTKRGGLAEAMVVGADTLGLDTVLGIGYVNAQTALFGTTYETLASFVVPPDAVKPGDVLALATREFFTNSANQKRVRYRFGGVVINESTFTASTNNRRDCEVVFKSLTTADYYSSKTGSNAPDAITGLDLSVENIFTIEGYAAVGPDVCGLSYYRALLLRS